MDELLNFALLSFASLFSVVNPVGVVPVFITMTAGLERVAVRRTATRAVVTSFLILLTFALTGQMLFQFFGISVNSLRVVGGVIFFFIGYDMLQARLSRTKLDEESEPEYVSDIAITPLAIPIISGPGAITTIIVRMGDAPNLLSQVAVLGVTLLVMLITLALLIGGERVMRTLGDSGSKVLMRLMGLIVMSIAVEFFFGGLTPIVREMLLIEVP